jgi:arylsulfatase A-like enzyme
MNDVLETPNFDRIAERGVLFRNAFVNAPSCTPCRSALVSGQYFWRTGRGAILQGARWDARIPSWPLLLNDAGYHIGKTWKVWSPGTPADAPFGGQAHAFQPAGGRFNQFSENATRMVAGGMRFEEAKRRLLDDVRANFRAFLVARDGDEPFCYWFGPTNVHRTWVRGSGRALWGIDPDEFRGKLPPFLPDVPEVREDLADYFGEIQAFDAALGVLVEELVRASELENTLVVVSGDHGAPGFPHGKCNLYDFGTRVALAVAGSGVMGGRVVDDFTILPDLAPTFLEAADVPVPDVMTAKSLRPVLESEQEGLVDPERTAAIFGRERHVEMARAGYAPYPQRAIRTAQYLYIINFRPERNPLGDPLELESDDPPTAGELAQVTFVAFPDDDAGPTKAFIVENRDHPKWKQYFEHTYGRRPKEELYDLRKDPHQMRNLAGEAEYREAQSALREQLLDELTASGDPRLVNDGEYFETPPLAGPLPHDVERPDRQRKSSRGAR